MNEELIVKVLKEFGIWAALGIAVVVLLYKGMAHMIPIWTEKLRAEAESIRKRNELEMDLMNKKHAAEAALIMETSESVRTAIPNAMHEIGNLIKLGHQRSDDRHATLVDGQVRIEIKLDKALGLRTENRPSA